MAASVIGNSVSALQIAQRNLTTVSNNIANVNTEGYSRQYIDQTTQFGGDGVKAGPNQRVYTQFIDNQLRSSHSAFADVDQYHAMAAQVDNILASTDTGLMPTMKAFFNSVSDVANNPSSLAVRQVMLANGESLTSRFNGLQASLSELDQQVAGQIDSQVVDLNKYATAIADLNVKIRAMSNPSTGMVPNDLMDQRDLLINKVAGLADVSTLAQSDGSVTVFLGGGQPLVMGANASKIELISSPFNQTDKAIKINGEDITGNLSGGSIKGVLRFKSEILDPAKQQLGLVALSLATQFNAVSATGYDLNGNEGLAFFDVGAPEVQVLGKASDAGLEVAVFFVQPTDPKVLGASYRLDVTGTLPPTYSLTNLTDNSQQFGLDDTTLPIYSQAFGFDISFGGSGVLTQGDSFTISPTYSIARDIRVNTAITLPEQIAAAGSRIPSATSLTGYAGVPGDNAVALQLAAIESSNFMQNDTVTLKESYGNLVADVGSKTHSAEVSRTAQDTLLQQAKTSKENTSGVNLDQEAADLIKFQQAYQAAAQSVSLAKELFQTLMNAM